MIPLLAETMDKGLSQGLGLGLSSEQFKDILQLCTDSQKLTVIIEKIGFSNRTKFRNKYITPLLNADLLAMLIPEKPTSSLQKYQTTEKGLQFLAQNTGGNNGK